MPCDFTVLVRRHANALVVAVHGEVDIATAPELQDAVAAALRELPAVLVIDLTDVAFLSATGLFVLAWAADAAQRTAVRVVTSGRKCEHPIRMTGLDTVLVLHGSVGEALR